MRQKTEPERILAAERRQLGAGRLAAAALVTAAVALAANGAVYLAGRGLLSVPGGLSLLSPGAVVLSTVAGVTLGAAGLAVLVRNAQRPLTTFRRLALLVGALSLLGPLAAAIGIVADAPDVGVSTFVVLALMNIVTTAAIMVVLPPAAAVRDRRPVRDRSSA
jgi:hypothetical protein